VTKKLLLTVKVKQKWFLPFSVSRENDLASFFKKKKPAVCREVIVQSTKTF